MTIKPFAIQGADLTLGGVNLQAGTTGVVIPGVTQAASYKVEEVNDTGDQTQGWGEPGSTFPTVIDNGQYSILNGDVQEPAGYSPAVYEVQELDGEEFIDGIDVTDGGSFPQSFNSYVSGHGLWAASGNNIENFDPQWWFQIPFEPKVRAGEIESIGGGGNANTGNFTFSDDTITNDNGLILSTDRGTLAIGTNMETPGVAGHFHIGFNGSNSYPPSSDLFLGDDYNYVKLPGYELNPADHGVEIGTHNRNGGNSYNWRFGTDGSLTFPDSTVQTTAYTGQDGGGADINNWLLDITTVNSSTGYVAAIAAVEYDTEGNVLATGYRTDGGPGQAITLMKFDTHGNLIWQNLFADSVNIDGYGLAVDNNNDVIVSGKYDTKLFLLKVNGVSGNGIWGTSIADAATGTNTTIGLTVEVDSNNDIIVTGYVSDTTNNNDNDDLIVAKFANTDGAFIWGRKLGDAYFDQSSYGLGVGALHQNEIVVVGYNEHYTGGVVTGVASVSPTDNLNWAGTDITIISPNANNHGLEITVTFTAGVPAFTVVSGGAGNGTGNIIIDGTAIGGTSGADDMTINLTVDQPYVYDSSAIVVKYDTDGVLQWQKEISVDSNESTGSDADIDSNGNIYVAANYGFNNTTTWGVVMSLNSVGDLQWSRQIGLGYCFAGNSSIVVGADNLVYVGGMSSVGTVDQLTDANIFAGAYDAAGQVQWQRTFGNPNRVEIIGAIFDNSGASNFDVHGDYLVFGGGNYNNFLADDSYPSDPRGFIFQMDKSGSEQYWGSTALTPSYLPETAVTLTVVTGTLPDVAWTVTQAPAEPPYQLDDLLITKTLGSTGGAGGTFDGSTAALTLTGKIPYTQPVLVAAPVTFTRPNNSVNTVDVIDTDVTFKRSQGGGALFNSAAGETSWNQNQSPLGTEWNFDGWGDLADVKTRTYTTFNDAIKDWGAANIHHREFVMHDTINDKYYTFKFTWWQANGGGGSNQSMDDKSGFTYVRQLINTDPTVIFVHPAGDANSDQDEIDTGLVITRGTGGGGIYNSADDVEWDPDFTPYGTLWNDEGWDDFENITARDWRPFFTAVHGRLGNEIVGRELLMKDTGNNKYYLIKFTEWGSDNGGSFAYTRRQVNPTGTKLGITFADGTQQTTAGITFKNGALELPYKSNTGYESNYTINGPTLQLRNDSTNEVVVTGPPATANDSYAQRIVIQGQRGYGRWGQNIAGEGGDVYIWGGTGGEADNNSGGSGGDVKVRGGQGQDNEGGYVKIEAGDASHYGSTYYGNGGYVQISAGDVTNSGGDSNNRGGDVTITAGMARSDSAKSGAINLYTGGNGNDGTQKYWSFRNDGVLQLPVGADIVASDGTTSVLGGSGGGGFATTSTLINGSYSVSLSSSTGILTLSTASTILGAGTDPNVYIETSTTATTSIWTFGTDGNLTFPDATVQTTAYLTGQTTIELDATTETTGTGFVITLLNPVIVFQPATGYTNITDHTGTIIQPTVPGQKLSLFNMATPNNGDPAVINLSWTGTDITFYSNIAVGDNVELTAIIRPTYGLTWYETNRYTW